eukprot:scaffold389099_cov41-Prasinocladus_malaysianus.AAC.1
MGLPEASTSMPSIPETRRAASGPQPPHQLTATGKDTVKVLCSYGGLFVENASCDSGKQYQGGTTRLISLELTAETTFSNLLLQLAASSLGMASGISEKDLKIHYELPGEHG